MVIIMVMIMVIIMVMVMVINIFKACFNNYCNGNNYGYGY